MILRRRRRIPTPGLRPAPAATALAALVALAAPVASGAQQVSEALRRTVSDLEPSTTVRVIAPGVYVDPGRFLGVQGDSLLLSDADVRLSVAFDELEELAVRKSQWLEASVTAAGVAAVFGAAIGYFIGTGDCDFRLSGCGRYQFNGAFQYGSAFAAVGAVVGAVAGSRHSTWRTVFP